MSYPYRAIDLPNETRILTIQPGEYDDPIICSLTHIPLAKEKVVEQGSYECLSYCWAKSVNAEFVTPDDAIVGYAYGGDEAQSGEIAFCDMLDHPELHSLYVQFGGRLPSGTITCDGVTVTIGGELHRAIRRIRPKDSALRIWVDALCIDQGNMEERNKHVLMMGTIYAGASHLRIWLGESTGMETLAFEVLAGIHEIANDALNESTMNQKSLLDIQKALKTHSKTQELDWESLKHLFTRAWFRRIWVLQEAVNSAGATVHVGDSQVRWDWISSALELAIGYKMEGLVSSIAIKPLSVMNWLRKERANSDNGGKILTPLLDLLEETRVFESTMPSDKIYGVLGLASLSDHVVIDYALSVEEVFTRLTTNMLRREQSLDILSHCMLTTTPSKLNLPTWVPDWTVHGWVEPFRSRKLKANAGGDTKAQFEIGGDNRILSIWGMIVGKVEAIEHTKIMTTSHEVPESLGAPRYGIRKMKTDEEMVLPPQSLAPVDRNSDRSQYWRNEAKNTLLDIYNIASPSATPTPEIRERIARTFALNRKRDGSKIDQDFVLGFHVHATLTCEDMTVERVFRWITEEETGCDELSREGRLYQKRLRKAYSAFIGSHYRWCYNRRFLRTTGGSFGWGVNGVEVGDVIAIFYGGNYPFILRERGNGQYAIIGDCYLEQFMNGEAMSDEQGKQVFDIV